MKCPRCQSEPTLIDETMETETYICYHCKLKITLEEYFG